MKNKIIITSILSIACCVAFSQPEVKPAKYICPTCTVKAVCTHKKPCKHKKIHKV
jgi:hypothetical protein